MKQFFNFKTKKEENPLEKITRFFINPYMPGNYKLLNLKDKYKEILAHETQLVTEDGYIPCVSFPIEYLVNDTAFIEWRSDYQFIINNSIYCKIVSEDTIRIDTVKF